MITWHRYVRHADVPFYRAKGWVVTDSLSGTSHGQWSVLMMWEGIGEPA